MYANTCGCCVYVCIHTACMSILYSRLPFTRCLRVFEQHSEVFNRLAIPSWCLIYPHFYICPHAFEVRTRVYTSTDTRYHMNTDTNSYTHMHTHINHEELLYNVLAIFTLYEFYISIFHLVRQKWWIERWEYVIFVVRADGH